MTTPNVLDPGVLMLHVNEHAVVFLRDTVDVPSGDEMRALMDRGTKFKYAAFGYLKVPGKTLSACTSSNQELDDAGKQRLVNASGMELVNALARYLMEVQKATPSIFVPDEAGKIEAP